MTSRRFVGNNWDGTADVIDSTGSYDKVGRVDMIPDKNERLREINLNPIKLAYFLGIRATAGEGHDQSSTTCTRPPTGPRWSPRGPASPTSSRST